MPRLRYSLEDAKEAATEIAIEAIRGLSTFQTARLISVSPDKLSGQGHSSKHPSRWIAMFVWHDPSVILDGGETFVAVDLESKTGKVLE